MLARALTSVVVAAGVAAAQQPDEDGRYTISAPGIKAQVSYYTISMLITTLNIVMLPSLFPTAPP